jgi:hypothetical protein
MSSGLHHPKESWIDRFWPVLLVAFGISCILFLACYKKFW